MKNSFVHISSDVVFFKILKCRNAEIFIGIFFFLKNPITKNQKPKKCHFPAPPILNIFLQKFQGLVFG